MGKKQGICDEKPGSWFQVSNIFGIFHPELLGEEDEPILTIIFFEMGGLKTTN